MTKTTLLAIAVALAPAAKTFADTCHQPGDESSRLWTAPVPISYVYPSAPNDNPDSWSFSQQSYYYRQINLDTPDEACKLWAQYDPGNVWTAAQRANAHVKFINETTYKCAFDCTGDGVVNADDYSACPANINAVENTDPVCDTVTDLSKVPYVNTYAPSGSHFIRGATFTTTQKNLIKAANSKYLIWNSTTGTYEPIYFSDAENITRVNAQGQTVNIETYDTLTGTSPDPSSPEVDHLVPRVDRYGCGCGTNAPSNALLISRALNNSLSNNPANVDRVAVLAYFAEATARVAPSEGSGSDSTITDSDEVGCSAGGGGASTLALVAVGLTLARRRRRHRAG